MAISGVQTGHHNFSVDWYFTSDELPLTLLLPLTSPPCVLYLPFSSFHTEEHRPSPYLLYPISSPLHFLPHTVPFRPFFPPSHIFASSSLLPYLIYFSLLNFTHNPASSHSIASIHPPPPSSISLSLYTLPRLSS